MPMTIPVPDKASGDVLTETNWDAHIRDNINKLLQRGHRVLTVAQFAALTGLEGAKGTLAPDEVYLEVDAANGIQWHLGYETSESTFKWRMLGGPDMEAVVETGEGTGSASFVALATVGPSIAIPRAGDYDVTTGCNGGYSGTQTGMMSYDIGGTGAVDADGVSQSWFSSDHTRVKRKAGLTSVTLTAKYKQTGGAATSFGKRRIRIRPVRIRHDA